MRCSLLGVSTRLNTSCKPTAAIVVSGYSSSNLNNYYTGTRLLLLFINIGTDTCVFFIRGNGGGGAPLVNQTFLCGLWG